MLRQMLVHDVSVHLAGHCLEGATLCLDTEKGETTYGCDLHRPGSDQEHPTHGQSTGFRVNIRGGAQLVVLH